MSEIPTTTPESSSKGGPRRILVPIVIVAILAYAGYSGVRSYTFGQSHAETDDAYVTGDLVNIGPIVGGTLSELTVEQGEFVKKGQLVGRLEDSNQQASLSQAQAALDAAQTQIPQAQAELKYQQLATQASIQRSQAGVAAQNSRTAAARLLVGLNSDTNQQQIRQAQSQVEQAQANSAQAKAGIETARAALRSAQAAVITAQRQFAATQSSVEAVEASAAKVGRELQERVGRHAATRIEPRHDLIPPKSKPCIALP